MTSAQTHAHRHDPDTSHDAAAKANLNYHQVARRISDLKRDGKVKDTGERRASPGGRRAAVWGLV